MCLEMRSSMKIDLYDNEAKIIIVLLKTEGSEVAKLMAKMLEERIADEEDARNDMASHYERKAVWKSCHSSQFCLLVY